MSRFASPLFCFFWLAVFSSAQGQQSGLEPWAENRWYWSYHGEPILLLGGSDDDNLFQWPADRLVEQLDRIVEAGGNVIRNTMSDRKDGGFEVYAFKQLPSGKYDLSQWNPEYWLRFERMLAETAKRDIIVQIEIWDRFDYTDVRAHDPKRWENHPYSPANNVNYTFEASGFERRYPDHPGQNKQPFFFTTPAQRNNQIVLPFQVAFVNKMLDHSLKYDHVLYCMDNETRAQPEWGQYWAKLVRRRSEEFGRQVMITEMWDDWDLTAQRHRQTMDHPELYDFVDVSQNNQNSGQKHWDNFLYVREYLSSQPRPMNTTKTYGADGNKFKHTDQDGIERFWRHLLAGAASIRFHRPDSGLGINDQAVACIKAARQVEKIVPYWELEPANQSLTQRTDNEAYAATTEDRQTLVLYFPATASQPSSVGINHPKFPRYRSVRWISIDRGELGENVTLEGNEIRPPTNGNWVGVLASAK